MSKIKIACLPIAGIGNPYQKLMMDGLSSDERFEVVHGIDNKLLGLLLSVLKHKPNYLHLDWLSRYYHRKSFFLTLLTLPSFVIQVGLLKSFLFKVKLVWTLHNIEPHDIKHPFIHRYVRSFFARRCDWIRVFSASTIERASEYLRVEPARFRVVAEGSYVDYYPDQVDKKEARAYFNLPTSARVYLTLGLIKPYKGIRGFIDFFNKARREGEYLIIAGKIMDEEYGKELMNKLSPYILLFDKFICENELQLFFNASDIVVLPFKKVENSGSVIMAMGFRKPVIAPDIGVIHERLQAQPELLFINDMAEVWQKQLTFTEEELSEMGQRNFKMLEKFQWTDFMKLFKD